MKTPLISPTSNALSSSPETSASSAPAPSPSMPGRPAALGRPSALNAQMLDALCAVIRATGASDSAAAAQVGVHPSTVSRWKRDVPDVAIMLRTAREEFRMAQLSVIMAEAGAGHARSWRAAAWLLERIFPQDYAPRARERAQFQEQYEAACASEAEGSELELPEEEALQNVQNATPLPLAPVAVAMSAPVAALQNVQNSAPSPQGGLDGPAHHPVQPLQNVQNAAAPASQRRATSDALNR